MRTRADRTRTLPHHSTYRGRAVLILMAVVAGIWLLLGVLAIAACIRSGQLVDPQDQYLLEEYEQRAASNF